MSNYNADSQSIGDWMGREDEAMCLWNDHIAPALRDLHHQQGTDGGDADRVAYKQDWAWDQFCSRIDLDGDAMSEAKKIADELRRWM